MWISEFIYLKLCELSRKGEMRSDKIISIYNSTFMYERHFI